MKAVLRPLFLVDVDDTADYLFTEANESTASRWRDELKQTMNLIREFPEIGRLRSDLPIKDIRTLQIKGFSQLARVLSHHRGSNRISARQTRDDAPTQFVRI